mgnify:CR=1 FL=1
MVAPSILTLSLFFSLLLSDPASLLLRDLFPSSKEFVDSFNSLLSDLSLSEESDCECFFSALLTRFLTMILVSSLLGTGIKRLIPFFKRNIEKKKQAVPIRPRAAPMRSEVEKLVALKLDVKPLRLAKFLK